MVSSTQQSVPIAGVKDGIIVLKNGGYRMILEISAINFSLKSEQEQNSLVFQYQSFLNSLHFPIQIVIKSKLLDLSPYLNKVKQASDKSLNELIKTQIEDYIDFVGKLVSVANIMKKSFYIIIP
jgi:type IV secretory pathway VirB4 component